MNILKLTFFLNFFEAPLLAQQMKCRTIEQVRAASSVDLELISQMEQIQTQRLKELLCTYYKKAFYDGKEITKTSMRCYEIDGIRITQYPATCRDKIMIGISIPYFESEKSTILENYALFELVSLLSSLYKFEQMKTTGIFDTTPSNTFIERAHCIPLTDPNAAEKSYLPIGDESLRARCRRIAVSQWFGLGETQYRIECLIYIPKSEGLDMVLVDFRRQN